MKTAKGHWTILLLFLALLAVYKKGLSQEYIQHIASANNTIGPITTISTPSTNGHPETILVILRVANLRPTITQPEFSVVYRSNRWCIFRKDRKAIALNTEFTIAVKQIPDEQCFTIVINREPGNVLASLPDHPKFKNREMQIYLTEKWDKHTAQGWLGKAYLEPRHIPCSSLKTIDSVLKYNVLLMDKCNPITILNYTIP